jgi:hypothetical protein
VRATPSCCTKHDLDLLTTRQTPHGVVGHELGFQAKVSKVLFYFPANKGTQEAETLRFPTVDLEDFLKKFDFIQNGMGVKRQVDVPSQSPASRDRRAAARCSQTS